MSVCNSYHIRKSVRYIKRTPTYEDIPECWGTKERDVCSCGGDRTRCDFYPEVREKAEDENEGVLYLKNAMDMLYEYGKIKNYDVICEVSVIGTVISKLKSGEWS